MKDIGGLLTAIMAVAIGVFCYQLDGADDSRTLAILAGLIALALYGFFASLILSLEN